MPRLTEKAFTFESRAMPRDTFSVVRFSGEEGLSTLYRFDILLISEEQDLDIATALQHPATFTIMSRFAGGPELPYHGILSAFEQLHQFGPYTFYRAELRPKLWWLTQTRHNQVFLDQKIDQFAEAVLKDGGLAQEMDFEFRLQGQYDPREYVCQYGESHFDFVSRWMEREGIYYWFEQGEQSEKMVVSDTHIAHTPLAGHETFLYSPPSGLDESSRDKVIKRFSLKQTPMPKNVLLKDYNYMKPSLDLEGKAQVREQGRGEIYLYGEHFPNRSEGERLAQVRAEAYLCREKVFNSQSTVPAVRPGYLFTLERHYSQDFNRSYLTTMVRHEGSQEQYLVSGLGVEGVEDHQGLFYRNTFSCISGDTQYRPERITPKPRIAGSLSAKIDAAGSGKYAELDEHGRYKVILPFDMSGRKDGKASAWIRMMQPYAGQGMGFHAPLHKGTEVLLSFIEADPDRPVISGAIPNPETPGPVNDGNQTQVRLQSASGNVMHMEDQEGSERILMHSPKQNSFVRLGAPNDPDIEWHEIFTEEGLAIGTGGSFDLKCKVCQGIVLGECSDTVLGANVGVTGGIKTEVVLGGHGSYTPKGTHLKGSEQKVIADRVHALEQSTTVSGTITTVAEDVEDVVNQEVRVTLSQESLINALSEVVDEQLRAVNERIGIIGNEIVGLKESLRTTGQRIDAANSHIRIVDTMISQSATQIFNTETELEESETQIGSFGQKICAAELQIRDAPVLIDG